MKYDLKG